MDGRIIRENKKGANFNALIITDYSRTSIKRHRIKRLVVRRSPENYVP